MGAPAAPGADVAGGAAQRAPPPIRADSVVTASPPPRGVTTSSPCGVATSGAPISSATGSSADRRPHVRWWQSDEPDAQARPLWLGDASFDIGSGVSHLTGQITHHIAPDIDAERDALIADIETRMTEEQREEQLFMIRWVLE